MKKRIFKNTLKVILTIALTIAAYKYAAIERGYYLGIIGGGKLLCQYCVECCFGFCLQWLKKCLRK